MSEEFYNLATTRNGQVPVKEIREGDEVLCRGVWRKAPKPVFGKAVLCRFASLPSCAFEPSAVDGDEFSISHCPVLSKGGKDMPELSVIGYFRPDNKTASTVFKGTDSLAYWLPRFIKFYDEPMCPDFTAIGFNFRHSPKRFPMLSGDMLSERNLERVLEGMLRRNFCLYRGKWMVMPLSAWTETHRLVMRLLDVECEAGRQGKTIVRNPVSLYRHVRDSHNKRKVPPEQVALDLKRSAPLPPYTGGHFALSKEEAEAWILPGANPDVNGVSPSGSELGYTKRKGIRADASVPWKDGITRNYGGQRLEGNFFSALQKV